ncbi:MAG: hypothetical protein H0V25_02050 [Solirubrobacterales bacterium]|nr:hypothetical protein [Solirubrobacterales bacterium]
MAEGGVVLVAHAGHWVLYIGPVLVVLVAVIASAIRERRARQAEAEDDGPGSG